MTARSLGELLRCLGGNVKSRDVPVQAVLSADMFATMVTKIAIHVAKNLETLLFRKHFTQLGSVQVRRGVWLAGHLNLYPASSPSSSCL